MALCIPPAWQEAAGFGGWFWLTSTIWVVPPSFKKEIRKNEEPGTRAPLTGQRQAVWCILLASGAAGGRTRSGDRLATSESSCWVSGSGNCRPREIQSHPCAPPALLPRPWLSVLTVNWSATRRQEKLCRARLLRQWRWDLSMSLLFVLIRCSFVNFQGPKQHTRNIKTNRKGRQNILRLDNVLCMYMDIYCRLGVIKPSCKRPDSKQELSVANSQHYWYVKADTDIHRWMYVVVFQ